MINYMPKIRGHSRQWSTAAEIPVFITGRPIITRWDDYSTDNIPTVILKSIQ